MTKYSIFGTSVTKKSVNTQVCVCDEASPRLRAMAQPKSHKFAEKFVITVMKSLIILCGKSWKKYKHFQTKNETFEVT